ncbi:MAG: hypothetical protein ACM36A_11700 [Bacteroidota bacterium]
MRSLLTALLLIAPLAHGSVTRSPPAPRPAAPEPGVQAWPDGDRYEGEWRAGKPFGRGVAKSHGVHVRGRWVDGCLRKGPFLFAVDRPASECR